MSTPFCELQWHDAVISKIEIDRRRPGERDEVVVTILWPDEQSSRIRFFECYAMKAELNFGVVAAETVKMVQELEDSDGLKNVRDRWSQIGVDLSALKCFVIETNSTASTIEVYALGWSKDSAN
jgi:hypothetical protein